MDRRTLLRTTALLPVGLVMGCAGGSLEKAIVAVPQFVADVQVITENLVKYKDEVKTIIGGTAKVIGATTATIAKVQGWVDEAAVLATQITTTASAGTTAVAGLVSRYGGVFQRIAAATSGAHGTWETVLLAGKSLLPDVLSAVGIPMADAAPPPYRPEMARAMLTQLALHR